MVFKCKECHNELIHINYENWLCEKCFKVIQIMITKNWKNHDKDKIIFHNKIENRNVIYHEIYNNDESKKNYYDLLPKLMEVL